MWREMHERWAKGERVRAKDYLKDGRISEHDEKLLLDLIYAEICLRRQHGELANPQEYIRLFPQLAPALRRQFALEAALQTGVFGMGPGDLAPSTEREQEQAPETIGRFRVVGTLGSGGQAVVYHAIHPELHGEVVIKLSKRTIRPGTADRDRLVREGRVLARLEHPNIACVYDLDFHENRPFLVMKRVVGVHLEQAVAQRSLTPQAAATIVAQLARALDYAHRRGVTHGDVKPRNVVLDEMDVPHLIDFGVSELSDPWIVNRQGGDKLSGTVAFMAPEQAQGSTDALGPRTDVFCLGATLYYLLTGSAPFTADTFEKALERARTCDWDRELLAQSQAPARLRTICERAMAFKPEARHRSAGDLAKALEQFVSQRSSRGTVVALFAVVALALAVWIIAPFRHPALGPSPNGSPAERTPERPPGQQVATSLAIEVWRNGQYVDLLDAVPLHTGDELSVQLSVPPNLHAALCLLTSEGQLRILRSAAPMAEPQELRYPREDGQSVPLVGPPGVECLMACVRASKPVTSSEIEELLDLSIPWPAPTGITVIRLLQDRARIEQRDRDFGVPLDRPDPEGEIRRRLEAYGARASGVFDHVEAIVFAHTD